MGLSVKQFTTETIVNLQSFHCRKYISKSKQIQSYALGRMNEMNAVAKSESLSSYLSCCKNENEKIVASDHTKAFTNTKSRLLLHYKENGQTKVFANTKSRWFIHYKETARTLSASKSTVHDSGSSTPTLRSFQQRLMLQQHHQENKSSEERLLSQKSYNQPFDVEKFRRHLSRKISASSLIQNSWAWRTSGHPKKDLSIGVQVSNENYTEICENSTSTGTKRPTNPKEILSVRDHSFIQTSQVNVADTPLKSNTILSVDKCETDKELLRQQHDVILAHVSRNKQHCPQRTPPNEIQSETEPFALKINERSSASIDFQSIRQSVKDDQPCPQIIPPNEIQSETEPFTLKNNERSSASIDFQSIKQSVKDDQPCPQIIPPNEIQNETESFTLKNNERSSASIDFQSIKQSVKDGQPCPQRTPPNEIQSETEPFALNKNERISGDIDFQSIRQSVKDGQPCPQRTPPNEIQNETESFTLNKNERSSGDIDFQSIRQSLKDGQPCPQRTPPNETTPFTLNKNERSSGHIDLQSIKQIVKDGQPCPQRTPPNEIQNETEPSILNKNERSSGIIDFQSIKQSVKDGQPCPQRSPPNEIQNETELSMLNKSERSNGSEMESITLNNNGHSNESIDFQSIRQSLKNSSSPIKKFDLIQSLVLRLSNQKPGERFTTVQHIVDNDVLGVSGESGNSNTLKNLLWPLNIATPHPLQVSVAKLLNDLVSFEVGRNYFNKISMVKLLTWNGSEQIYASMADNMIGALTKLSLNQFQRRDMLENGLFQWLISRMEKVVYSASTVQMKCMTDLLRVLVENTTEFRNEPHLIVVLVRYLKVENEYVQANLAHILRTLLSSDTAVAIGNNISLHRIIRNIFEKSSNLKLKEDLRFIYDLFVKYRTDSSNRSVSYAGNASVSTVSENTIYLERQELNSDIDNQNEQLIREQNLMRKSDIIEESDSNEEEIGQQPTESSLSLTEKKTDMFQAKPNNFPADLRSYIVQLCAEKNSVEMDRKKSDDEQHDQSATIALSPCAEILYSNLNSRLEQSSSLLSSGSQCASSECKESAIQILKMQSIEANSAGEMDLKRQKFLKISSSKLQLKEMPTDYSNLSSIAKNRDARNEILDNDSFINELCDKVFNKLKSKLAANFFCGPNCGNTTSSGAGCCANGEANVQ